jgi:hypothetical protein
MCGDVPKKDDLTPSQWRALARIRAGRPDALLLWQRRAHAMLLEISTPPTRREPGHSLVVVAFARDGSVHVERQGPIDDAS